MIEVLQKKISSKLFYIFCALQFSFICVTRVLDMLSMVEKKKKIGKHCSKGKSIIFFK